MEKEEYVQMKEQEETPEKNPKAMEISNLPDKEFKESVIECSTTLRVQ